MAQFLSNADDGEDADHHHEHHGIPHEIHDLPHGNGIHADDLVQDIHNHVHLADVSKNPLIEDTIEHLTPHTPILTTNVNFNDETLRDPYYFNEDVSIHKKLDLYKKYISSDSFRKSRGRGSPSYKRIKSSKLKQLDRTENRPPSSQIIWNHLNNPEFENQTPFILNQIPSITETLSTLIRQTTSQPNIPINIPIESNPTTSEPPALSPLVMVSSTPANDPLQDSLAELARLIDTSDVQTGSNQDELIFTKEITEPSVTASPDNNIQQITTLANRIPPEIEGLNQIALLSPGLAPNRGNPTPSALAFQVKYYV